MNDDAPRRLETRFAQCQTRLDRCAVAGFEGVRPAFEARFRMAGRRVRVVELAGEEFEGVAKGIDADGALRLETADGTLRRVIAGDVTIAKESA